MSKRTSLIWGILILVTFAYVIYQYHSGLLNIIRLGIGAMVGFFSKLTLKQILFYVAVVILKSIPVWARKAIFEFIFFIVRVAPGRSFKPVIVF